MKIFIYHELINNPNTQRDNAYYAQRDRLIPHLQYLHDIYELFKKYETKNPDEADYFFVPLFITGLQWSNIDPEYTINSACQYLNRGNHILVSTGDVGQRAESRHEMTEQANPQRAYNKKYKWLDDRFILIALESTASLHPRDIAILPYQHHEPEEKNVEKDIFASFVGGLQHPHLPTDHIRGGRLIELRKKASEKVLILSPEEAVKRLGGIKTYSDVISRSTFTLCPAGYGRWSFRFTEAILNKSIPVLISDDYILPMSDKIDWDNLIVRIPESELMDIEKTLSSIPPEKVTAMLTSISNSRNFARKDFNLSYIVERLSDISHADIAIGKMRGPEKMQIICVDVTNKCDLSCSNCTRLLKNQESFWEMTSDNFRLALQSLKNYQGIIAMIGGNPCVHTQFEKLCEIFREEIPNQFQRGLWTNNYFKHREVIEKTFGALNLNPHNVERANKPLKDLYKKMVEERGFNGGFYEKNSHHAPLLTAVKDLYPEKEMWDRISRCDINREWSASIVQNSGKLRAYFCEVAASFDLARGTDHGHEVVLDWWKRPITTFSDQIKHFCTGCGVPARLKGSMDYEETDTYTKSNADLAEKSQRLKNRKIKLLESEDGLHHRVTEYFKG